MPPVTRARCLVHVFKEGALSALGHDLVLELTDFHLTIEGETSVRAECRTEALALLEPRSTSASDTQTILNSTRKDVLETTRHPTATFESTQVAKTADRYHVQGRLRLHGVEQQVEVVATRTGNTIVAKLALDQPRFGIKVFKAALGALRVKREVMLEIRAEL